MSFTRRKLNCENLQTTFFEAKMTEEPSIDNKLEYFTILILLISIPDKKAKNGIVIFFAHWTKLGSLASVGSTGNWLGWEGKRGCAGVSSLSHRIYKWFFLFEIYICVFYSNSLKCCEWDIYDRDRVLLQKPEIYISKSPELLNYTWAERS